MVMKKILGFTLAEIMIVLVVIGVLSAILLPVAINSTPNEDVMKFKKGHNALLSAIRELVNSDKYYLDGDLGIRANGDRIDGTHDGDKVYLCNSIAEMMSVNEVNCADKDGTSSSSRGTAQAELVQTKYDTVENMKPKLDDYCLETASSIGAEITTSDDIIYYQISPENPFGVLWMVGDMHKDGCYYAFGEEACKTSVRLFSPPNGPIYHQDGNGFDRVYKVFCMDIDGIDNGEDPFGYGIRADGKVLFGARAEQWLQKSIQEKE